MATYKFIACDRCGKQYINKELRNTWDIKRTVERMIEKKIKGARDRLAKKIAEEDLTDEILAEFK